MKKKKKVKNIFLSIRTCRYFDQFFDQFCCVVVTEQSDTEKLSFFTVERENVIDH